MLSSAVASESGDQLEKTEVTTLVPLFPWLERVKPQSKEE